MEDLQTLNSIFDLVIKSLFLLTIFVSFTFVYVARMILRIWLPKFENNRWFKTFLPIGTLLISCGFGVAFSFIPGLKVSWAIGLLTGVLAGLVLLVGYTFIRNFVREKTKALAAKILQDKNNDNQ